MEQLIESLRQLQADVVKMYTYTHNAHWNVEGILFAEYHALFEKIYDDVYGQIDPISENIRKCGGYTTYPSAPALEVETSPRALTMHIEMLNEVVINQLKHTFVIANGLGEQGVANYVADRIDKHQFWAWWLKASLASSSV